jgi:hypothetical protein
MHVGAKRGLVEDQMSRTTQVCHGGTHHGEIFFHAESAGGYRAADLMDNHTTSFWKTGEHPHQHFSERTEKLGALEDPEILFSPIRTCFHYRLLVQCALPVSYDPWILAQEKQPPQGGFSEDSRLRRDVREKAHEPRALDRRSERALLLGRKACAALPLDLSMRREEQFQEIKVLIVNVFEIAEVVIGGLFHMRELVLLEHTQIVKI